MVVDQREQPVDDRLEPGDLAVAQQQLEHRVLGLDVEVGERVGIGGVTGLDALGLRQGELVEEDLLQLLGRAEVELAADELVGVVLDGLDPGAQLGLQGQQRVGVGGDADGLHVGEHVREGQLHRGEQGRGLAAAEFIVERVGEILDRGGPHGLDLGQSVVRLVQAAVQRQLHRVAVDEVVAAQLAVQGAQREVGEVEGALVGLEQVGRQLGVIGDAVQLPAVLGAGRAAGP